jgi:hypothetical protein
MIAAIEPAAFLMTRKTLPEIEERTGPVARRENRPDAFGYVHGSLSFVENIGASSPPRIDETIALARRVRTIDSAIS